jgi:hypothetical protein
VRVHNRGKGYKGWGSHDRGKGKKPDLRVEFWQDGQWDGVKGM